MQGHLLIALTGLGVFTTTAAIGQDAEPVPAELDATDQEPWLYKPPSEAIQPPAPPTSDDGEANRKLLSRQRLLLERALTERDERIATLGRVGQGLSITGWSLFGSAYFVAFGAGIARITTCTDSCPGDEGVVLALLPFVNSFTAFDPEEDFSAGVTAVLFTTELLGFGLGVFGADLWRRPSSYAPRPEIRVGAGHISLEWAL